MKALFVPSVREGEKIFGCRFEIWRHGIFTSEFRGLQVFTTGVSKIPTVFSLMTVLAGFDVTEAWLTGVCGAYRRSGLSVGDVVSVRRDYFADEGLYADGRFTGINEMGFGFSRQPYSEFKTLAGLRTADSATVSFLDGSGEISALFSSHTGADVENMEGAAFGYVCGKLGVDCVQVRAVSNFCGKRDEQEWNFSKAVNNLKTFFDSADI